MRSKKAYAIRKYLIDLNCCRNDTLSKFPGISLILEFNFEIKIINHHNITK